MSRTLLEVTDLTVRYHARSGWFTALQDVTFRLESGGAVGLVGESGSGKSTLALALLGLLPRSARVTGSIRFDGVELVGASQRALNQVRGREIGLVYQDALVSLNPVRPVGGQIGEVIRQHRPRTTRREARERVAAALKRVGIPQADERIGQYPHQYSGGMRQRAAIAMALAAQPRLLVADEVTTALDVTVQSQILALLADLRQELGMSTLLVSHDLDVVHGVTDNVLVLYAGRIIEAGRTSELLTSPRHPYTRGLVDSAPSVDVPYISFIPGAPPTEGAGLPGCAFAPRCWLREGRSECVEITPPLELAPSEGAPRRSACHFRHEMPAHESATRTAT